MQTVPVTLNVPKESKEIIDAVIVLVADIKAKKAVGDIAGDALPKIIAAIDGFEQLGEEVKSANKADLAAYGSSELLKALGL